MRDNRDELFDRCRCGHSWMLHDVDEYRGDGTETCCAEGCVQAGCPGREKPRAGDAPYVPSWA